MVAEVLKIPLRYSVFEDFVCELILCYVPSVSTKYVRLKTVILLYALIGFVVALGLLKLIRRLWINAQLAGLRGRGKREGFEITVIRMPSCRVQRNRT